MGNFDIKGEIKELVSVVAIAFILSMFLRHFVIEARLIPSGSMLPTIQLQNRVLVNRFIYRFTEPERGDVVVFQPPLETDEDYIKRVIGLPGDTLEVKDTELYINGNVLHEPYILEPMNYAFGPVTVPEGCLFVMGDNRNNSYDSHLWDKWLTIDEVKGKALVVFWPFKDMKKLDWEGSFDAGAVNE